MMTAEALPPLIIEWVQAQLPEIATGYPFTPTEKLGAFPDVAVEIARQEDSFDHPDLPYSTLQNVHVRVWTVELSFMVDNSDPAAAAATLRRYADTLAPSLVADCTLGERVRFASPLIQFDFTRPFVQYADGSKGREATARMTVGDLVEDAQ